MCYRKGVKNCMAAQRGFAVGVDKNDEAVRCERQRGCRSIVHDEMSLVWSSSNKEASFIAKTSII